VNFFKEKRLLPAGFYQSIINLSGWQKALIFIAAWIILIGPFVYFYALPGYEEIKTLSVNIPKLRQEVESLKEREKQLPAIRAEIREMEKILESALKLLPESKDIPSLLTEISTLGNTERLDFLSFKPQEEEKKEFYAEIPINMETTAPFHNTMLFFDKVSRMPRIVNMVEINIDQLPQELQVWSKKASAPVGEKKGVPSRALTNEKALPATNAEGALVDSSVEGTAPASTWVIKVRSQAKTYRFLTLEEQKSSKSAKKKQAKKR
jgi:type IV pilus assembly protein PilO